MLCAPNKRLRQRWPTTTYSSYQVVVQRKEGKHPDCPPARYIFCGNDEMSEYFFKLAEQEARLGPVVKALSRKHEHGESVVPIYACGHQKKHLLGQQIEPFLSGLPIHSPDSPTQFWRNMPYFSCARHVVQYTMHDKIIEGFNTSRT